VNLVMNCRAAIGTLHRTDAAFVAGVDPSERIELTLVLRRRAEFDACTVAGGNLSSSQASRRRPGRRRCRAGGACRASRSSASIRHRDGSNRRHRCAAVRPFGVRLGECAAAIRRLARRSSTGSVRARSAFPCRWRHRGRRAGLDDGRQAHAPTRRRGVEATARATAVMRRLRARVSYTPYSSRTCTRCPPRSASAGAERGQLDWRGPHCHGSIGAG
jgi:hypothetical protein